MARCGVYQVLCTSTGHRYVGSAEDIDSRWDSHKRDLRRGKHSNKALQYAWQLFGETAFEISVLEETDPKNLQALENHYLETVKPEFNVLAKAGSRSPGREKKIPTCLRLPESLIEELKKYCEENSKTMTEVVDTALRHYFRNHGFDKIPIYKMVVTDASYSLVKQVGSKVEVVESGIRNGVPLEEIRQAYVARYQAPVEITKPGASK